MLHIIIIVTYCFIEYLVPTLYLGFPGKDPTCNVGDLDLIPRLGRSPGGGHGNPLQYSWASLMAQPEKNLPAMWETWI